MSEINEAVEQALETKVLALVLNGVAPYKIAKELGVTRYQVEKICKSDAFRAALKTEGDRVIARAREAFKSKVDELAPLAYEALKKNLKDGKIEGVRVFAQIAGLLKEDVNEQQKDTNLTVLLPGAKLEGVIPATATKIEESEDA